MVNQSYEGLFREDYSLNKWGYRDHEGRNCDAVDGAKLIITGIERGERYRIYSLGWR